MRALQPTVEVGPARIRLAHNLLPKAPAIAREFAVAIQKDAARGAITEPSARLHDLTREYATAAELVAAAGAELRAVQASVALLAGDDHAAVPGHPLYAACLQIKATAEALADADPEAAAADLGEVIADLQLVATRMAEDHATAASRLEKARGEVKRAVGALAAQPGIDMGAVIRSGLMPGHWRLPAIGTASAGVADADCFATDPGTIAANYGQAAAAVAYAADLALRKRAENEDRHQRARAAQREAVRIAKGE